MFPLIHVAVKPWPKITENTNFKTLGSVEELCSHLSVRALPLHPACSTNPRVQLDPTRRGIVPLAVIIRQIQRRVENVGSSETLLSKER